MRRRSFLTSFAGFAVLGSQQFVLGEKPPATTKTTLTFKVLDGLVAGKDYTDESLRNSATVIHKRLVSDVSPNQKVSVRRVGKDAIEVVLVGFNKQQLAAAKRRITRRGSLGFAILANRVDHAAIIDKAMKLEADSDLIENKQLIAGWRSVATDSQGKAANIENHGQVISRLLKSAQGRNEFLVIFEPDNKRITGRHIKSVNPIVDVNGSPALELEFDQEGGRRVQALTGRNLPSKDGFRRRLAILLDRQVNSAPSLLERIGEKAHLSGNFSQQEVRDLAQILRAGELEVPLSTKPASEGRKSTVR